MADILTEVDIFRHLDRKQCLKLADSFVFAYFQSNDVVLRINEIPSSFFIIAEGTATVYQKLVNDESLIEVSKLVQSNYFGLKALYENKPASAQVKADAFLKKYYGCSE